MALRPIAERIVAEGGICMAEVHEHNATVLMAWVKDTTRHHAAEDCPNGKNCCHAPGAGEVELAASHINDMPQVCTCGVHA